MTQEQTDFLTNFNSKQRSFEMFTAAGDKKCQALTLACIKKVFGEKRITKEELQQFVGAKVKKLEQNEKFSEVFDSEPPQHIGHYIRKACEVVGYNFDFESYDVTRFAY